MTDATLYHRLLVQGQMAVAAPEMLKDEAQADTLAAAISSLCLLHCLALPLVLAFAPAIHGLQSGAIHGPTWLHWALIGIAIPASIHALRKGYAIHANPVPWKIATLGFMMVASGALAHGFSPIEQVLTVGGGAIIASAHWRNWRSRSEA